ncbi:PAS domain-containing protein [Adhaeribacter radiodurans]|uniref:histidine kinase n=1 Tax=Adhaeribacter radiodurans TaxID=2745197 RepID=A0A7L7L4U4_9BACT|nr:PAS domain-containing protein [Adhaeribacter radiodurans]QMU27828.1 PAS domain-containing protein [Adhaeribacter radiodurans]
MSDSTAQPPAPSINLGEIFPPEELLSSLLDVSLTGVIFFKPVYNADNSEIIDLAYVMLNKAAQRMLQLPARPGQTFLQLYPHATKTGIFVFYRDTFLSGKPGRYDVNYQHDRLDNYFQLAAQRSGQGLIVSFSDTSDHDRTAVEQALRESQVREREARSDADLQREQLKNIFMQAPAMVCIFEGPNHVFKLVNPAYQQLVGNRSLLGKPIAEAMPELAGQPIFGLLDKVYQTGETFQANEMLVQLDHDNSGGDLGQNYYNFIYQATRNLEGNISGIMVFAYEVTAQVRARRQVEYSHQEVQELNEELQALNEELQTTNEELVATNEEYYNNYAELLDTQQALQQLNEELEARVIDRTIALQAALWETEQQREHLREQQSRLHQILGQVPASIATLEGAEHRYTFFNDSFQALSGNRIQLGRTVAEVFPEVVEQGFIDLLNQVYTTGQPVIGIETPIQLFDPGTGNNEQQYADFIYQPIRNGAGQIQGILAFIVDVTDKVHAQQRADSLQAEVLATTKRQVQEREAFYQVFEQTPASIVLLRGPEHRVDYHNQAYQQLFPGRSMRGRTIAEIQPEAVDQGFVALLDRVYQTGETYYGNELLLTIEEVKNSVKKDRYFNFTYQPYRENNQIAGISVFAYDVTEQVLARREADQQRKILHQLFMEAPAPIVILDGADLVFQLVNPAYQQIFPGRELLGKSLLEALPELKETPIIDIITKVHQSGESFVAQEMPLMLARQHGGPLEQIYTTFTYQARRNSLGEVDGVMAFAYEVTDQVKARQSIEANAQQLQLITDALPVLISYLDREEKYRFVNQAYEAWFQQKPENLLNRPIWEVVGEKAYQGVKSYIDRALAGERLNFEARMPYRDNFTKYIRTSYVPHIREGEVVGFYSMVSDITDQVEAQQAIKESEQQAKSLAEDLATVNSELRQANQQLTRINVDLDNFIYTASHDLKAPILNIEGLVEALLEQLPPTSLQEISVQRTLALILDSVQRFKRTIDHLTEITKLQKENSEEASPVNLAALLNEVQLDLAPIMEAAQAQIVIDISLCPTIRFSEKNLRSIVYNLVSNAIKYHSPDRLPKVRVFCTLTDNYQILSVQDNGLGLDLAQQHKLFAMFKRLHNHVEGTGIGLYMVKKIIENAGGKIQVESKLGEGSTFHVYFVRSL